MVQNTSLIAKKMFYGLREFLTAFLLSLKLDLEYGIQAQGNLCLKMLKSNEIKLKIEAGIKPGKIETYRN